MALRLDAEPDLPLPSLGAPGRREARAGVRSACAGRDPQPTHALLRLGYVAGDPVDGDTIRQIDDRTFGGLRAAYEKTSSFGRAVLTVRGGSQFRYDHGRPRVDHAPRRVAREPIVSSEVDLLAAGVFVEADLRHSRFLRVVAGMRVDAMDASVRNLRAHTVETAARGAEYPGDRSSFGEVPVGERLVDFFDRADRLGGMRAKVRLANLTNTPSTLASVELDSPARIRDFDTAWQTIEREFARRELKPGEEREITRPRVRLADLPSSSRRSQTSVFLDLLSQRELYLSDMSRTCARVTEAVVGTIDVARASVWFLDRDRTRIVCADLYERIKRAHSSGAALEAKDYAPYFAALVTERTIVANDAHNDPRTSCFSKGYLTPLGIHSMLDVPIWADGRMLGVVCCEHIGPSRSWAVEEEEFCSLVAVIVALAYEKGARTA